MAARAKSSSSSSGDDGKSAGSAGFGLGASSQHAHEAKSGFEVRAAVSALVAQSLCRPRQDPFVRSALDILNKNMFFNVGDLRRLGYSHDSCLSFYLTWHQFTLFARSQVLGLEPSPAERLAHPHGARNQEPHHRCTRLARGTLIAHH